MPRKLARPLVLTALLAAGAQAQGLSAVEQRITDEVRAWQPEAINLLERSARINSGTLNLAGVRATGDVFRKELEALGFKTVWIDMPREMNRAGHLVANRSGPQGKVKGKRLLLLGHLDTVFEADAPGPLWERDSATTARGQGVGDMKGGNVVVIAALRALHRAGALDNTSITVVFTGDEEEAGHPREISRRDMIELAKRSDVALSFEGAVTGPDGQAMATVGRRATASFDLDVTGRQGHSQGVFGNAGYGAVYEAARILDGFRQHVVEPGLTFNPGVILGGTDVAYDEANAKGTAAGKTNVIANKVVVRGDLRYLDYAQRDRAQTRMREIVAQSLPGAGASITFRDSYPPMAVTPGNLKLLALYSQASSDAGLGPVGTVPPTARGAGDVQFVAPLIDSLDGLGASGGAAHSPNERVDLTSLERSAIRAALLMYRLTR
ncbi:M20/M25/M40 family metallo-hydrolase [Massilia sp. IC2-477]|uniref:M20/M25/M40 family metallo-hydrolase n=1 Tax=Massilia sp. IC2-477 TaxID=2887198 RepID=UPI001D105B94|nr:M20/M25/M40 family metallo-hydrolase [Massilia sp. IC2-477]MCC2958323.1 M20/M25/M40 family metallo-hydrolase [Massilia sp. IC2-477]